MNSKGLLIIISGYSGTGKGTVVKRLLEKYDERYVLSISATTREPRDGEIDGREYFFKSKEEFEEMIANEELIEHACYVDNYYGTPKSYVEDRLNEGRNVILEIEIQGALNVKELFPDSVLIFLLPPSVEELEKRLRSRGTETDELVNARLARAVVESESVYNYDYIVITDDIEECVDTINGIIPVEKLRVSHQRSFIKKIEDDLKAYKA